MDDGIVRSYKDLKVWQRAMDLTTEVYKLVVKLPSFEQYALSDQMRRAAVSIPLNIAEGHTRASSKEFKNFLSIAEGSNAEVETQLLLCRNVGYLTDDDIKTALDYCDQVGKMIAAIRKKL